MSDASSDASGAPPPPPPPPPPFPEQVEVDLPPTDPRLEQKLDRVRHMNRYEATRFMEELARRRRDQPIQYVPRPTTDFGRYLANDPRITAWNAFRNQDFRNAYVRRVYPDGSATHVPVASLLPER